MFWVITYLNLICYDLPRFFLNERAVHQKNGKHFQFPSLNPNPESVSIGAAIISSGQQLEVTQFALVLSMARARNAIVATGLVAFAAAGLAFPFYMASSPKPVIDPSKPLAPQATFRGPYINTGSRDVGPDHQTYPKK
ncbi:hypothetical protein Prudu_016339 [Prunus dulcis]|uniref:Transmembrane protein n=1 Tax=Prunus dulcis TaxID=3755 RepID=A0A4Y1RMD8_PRUDU|nr:hypothetical protein Prudu_016339 [Prunus dulcis]